MEEELVALLPARRGHFRLESGHHGDLWLDLDAVFLRPGRLRRFVRELAARLSAHGVEAVCGPLIGGAFVAQALAEALDVECYYAERHPQPQRAALYSVEYRLPAGLRKLVRAWRVALVDDVINAGSAVRGTAADLDACGASVVALGALLTLGEGAARFAAERGIPMERIAVLDNTLWMPEGCPLCAARVPLEDVAEPPAHGAGG